MTAILLSLEVVFPLCCFTSSLLFQLAAHISCMESLKTWGERKSEPITAQPESEPSTATWWCWNLVTSPLGAWSLTLSSSERRARPKGAQILVDDKLRQVKYEEGSATNQWAFFKRLEKVGKDFQRQASIRTRTNECYSLSFCHLCKYRCIHTSPASSTLIELQFVCLKSRGRFEVWMCNQEWTLVHLQAGLGRVEMNSGWIQICMWMPSGPETAPKTETQGILGKYNLIKGVSRRNGS